METFSNCCGAALSTWFEEPVCSQCMEHCEIETEDETPSQHNLDRQIASKLWILCNVSEFGLGAARRRMMQDKLSSDQIQRVSQILLSFN